MSAVLPLMVFLPMAAALFCIPLWKRSAAVCYALTAALAASMAALGGLLFRQALLGGEAAFVIPAVGGYGLSFRADGFRSLYALVASFMWAVAALFTPGYMAHGHSQGRYCAFTLMTLGATLGVFLSDDLLTVFLFFEIMSFTSYLWVMHEETPAAMRAAETYLAIAVLSGMLILMGLLQLKGLLGTLSFQGISRAAGERADKGALYLPCLLLLLGFGAKAGMFPLHIWLPKAHPVAPAPASALLSGVLTKVGVFGILVISSRVLMHEALFGRILLAVGLVTMFLGALLALFSVDLKRTLACSSMSQIGFILIGVSMQSLLGDENALAASGTVLHMVNHSLIKLCLFLCAGAVYMGLHRLDLNSIRGYGRGKPLFHVAFLVGAASISGVPLFSGYASKTLLHESLIEYVDHLSALGLPSLGARLAELLFVFTGGMTTAYMLKLYGALFHDRPAGTKSGPDTLAPLSRLALLLSAALLFCLGLLPARLMTPLADASFPFLRAVPSGHAVHFFSLENLLGAGKSLAIGVLLYLFLVRKVLAVREPDGALQYLDRWPPKLDLEEAVYRPLLRLTVRVGAVVGRLLDVIPDRLTSLDLTVGTVVARLLDEIPARLFSLDLSAPVRVLGKAPEALAAGLRITGLFFARVAGHFPDTFVAALWGSLFRRQKERRPVAVSNRLAFALGRAADAAAGLLNRTVLKTRPITTRFADMFAAAWKELDLLVRRVTYSLSFSLMVFALGLLLTMVYLLAR